MSVPGLTFSLHGTLIEAHYITKIRRKCEKPPFFYRYENEAIRLRLPNTVMREIRKAACSAVPGIDIFQILPGNFRQTVYRFYGRCLPVQHLKAWEKA